MSWPREKASWPGKYILSHGSVHSSLSVRAATAAWTCGHCETIVELQVLERLCALPEAKIYRVLELRVARASSSDSLGGSMSVAEQKRSSPSDTMREPQANDRGLVLQT